MAEKPKYHETLELFTNLLVTLMLVYMLIVGSVKTDRLERQVKGLERSLATATSLGCDTEDDSESEVKSNQP